ncbi:MAG: hypothetical protein MI922_11990 [Bacteroidales bacterium]|nr:hypothetical protein [Bacteroidales bacterium]
MKQLIRLFIFSTLLISLNVAAQDNVELVAQCAASAGDGITYLKDFAVKLDAGTPGGKPPSAKFSMVLSKSTQYRFSICTAPTSEGEAILQLFDMNVLQGSTYIVATGQEFPSFDFKCQKTGVYHIFISMKEGKPGEAVGILSFVRKL